MKRFDYEIIDSTNEEAKRKIIAGETGDFLLIAKEQTAGKGRKGRNFYSPKNTGLYMSFVHVGYEALENSVSVTTATSVIVRNAIKHAFSIECDIKWVNDLYFKGKKICGILCECVLPDSNRKETGIIVGIGINICTKDFPKELTEKAGALVENEDFEYIEKLISYISKELENYFVNPSEYRYIEEYRLHSCCIGKNVEISDATGVINKGIVKGFTDEGHLILEDYEGKEHILSSGEISLMVL